MREKKIAAALILVAALLGMLDSTFLVLQYLAALAHPGEPTPCTVSTLVSCTKTVQGAWAHYFGIPNPLLGMLWYAGLASYGIMSLAGSHIARRARAAVGMFIILGLLFSYRLYIASVLELAGVCPFCLFSTVMSTIIAVAFVIDDASYGDPVLSPSKRWVFWIFQMFSLLVFTVGLSVFMTHGLMLLPLPKEAMMHWSFPVIVLLIIGSLALHMWGYRSLRKL